MAPKRARTQWIASKEFTTYTFINQSPLQEINTMYSARILIKATGNPGKWLPVDFMRIPKLVNFTVGHWKVISALWTVSTRPRHVWLSINSYRCRLVLRIHSFNDIKERNTFYDQFETSLITLCNSNRIKTPPARSSNLSINQLPSFKIDHCRRYSEQP